VGSALPEWQRDPRVCVGSTTHRWDHCARLGIPAASAPSFIEVAGRIVVLTGSYAINRDLARKMSCRLNRVSDLTGPQNQRGEHHHERHPDPAPPIHTSHRVWWSRSTAGVVHE
jgi:hypothetical protein